MNNTLEGINRRITEAEEGINRLEDRIVEITATEENIEKRMKRNEDSLRNLHKIKSTNNIGVPKGEEREKGPEKNIWRDNNWKLPEHEKGNSQTNPGSTKSQEA